MLISLYSFNIFSFSSFYVMRVSRRANSMLYPIQYIQYFYVLDWRLVTGNFFIDVSQ